MFPVPWVVCRLEDTNGENLKARALEWKMAEKRMWPDARSFLSFKIWDPNKVLLSRIHYHNTPIPTPLTAWFPWTPEVRALNQLGVLGFQGGNCDRGIIWNLPFEVRQFLFLGGVWRGGRGGRMTLWHGEGVHGPNQRLRTTALH